MLGDNVGNGVLSSYNGGISDTPTPRSDSLGADGMRLTNFNVEISAHGAAPIRAFSAQLAWCQRIGVFGFFRRHAPADFCFRILPVQ